MVLQSMNLTLSQVKPILKRISLADTRFRAVDEPWIKVCLFMIKKIPEIN